MSYPATEVDVISNDSLFSDSVEFDAAEKPIAPEDDYGAVQATRDLDRGLPLNPDDDLRGPPEAAEEEEEEAAPPPPANAFMKPRRTATKAPVQWVPVNLSVPEDDPDDEFDISTAEKPIYADDADSPNNNNKISFSNGEPDMKGEITNCFEEPGLLYRIVDKKNKIWAFYNDSRAFEVHVTCTFGKHSKITPLERTMMTRDESTGEYVAQVTVYPGETELFIKGFVNGFTSKLRALPLSDAYFADRSQAQYEQIIQEEIKNIRAVVGEDETDAEVILRACLENDLPFVDLSFPPTQMSIELGASKPFKQLPWGRPRMYLKPELLDQVRLFRDGIRPGDVEQGELGDCWLMCAIAAHAEYPNAILQMFRHPKGADYGRRERAAGAYRVSFNKNGLWRSILVDDYLPVVAGTPKFAHSPDPCELWPAILEKAFAKMHRSYAMIQSGDPMHALTDMTGFPAMRVDDVLAEGTVNGGRDLYVQLERWHRLGYQTLLTTPGKAPAITPGSSNVPDFSEEPELEQAMAGTGFLPGHAYALLDVQQFDGGKTRLVSLRNPWVYQEGWTGPWGWASAEWDEHPEAARRCHAAQHRGDPSIVWMTLESLMEYFNGGGVLFRDAGVYEARVPMTFADCKPSVVLQLVVRQPVDLTLILSNVDHRGMHAEEPGAAEADPNNMEYPPVMLSLAQPQEGQTDIYQVVQNSAADATQPSDTKWTFLQAREIAMKVHLEPRRTPYLLIPRLMEGPTTMGNNNNNNHNNNNVEDFKSVCHPIHFVNDYSLAYPNEDVSRAVEVPVTIGVTCTKPMSDEEPSSSSSSSSAAAVQVLFCKMSGSNPVLENFPKFPSDDVEPEEELYYQTRLPGCGYAQEKTGSAV